MKNWKIWLSRLVSPMAVGLYITMVSVLLARAYYTEDSRLDTEGLKDAILRAHQWSIDHRLRVRGPRTVSNNLALLTVDEKAVDILGRWPWPREVLARATERAIQDGAKILAFDMVFAEPELNPVDVVLSKAHGKVTQDAESAFRNLAGELDGDKVLGATFTKHGDKIVAGSFANSFLGNASWPPETEFCRDLIFKRSQAFRQWDKEEVLLAVVDPFQPYLPTPLAEFFAARLDEVATQIRIKDITPKSKMDLVRLDQEVAAAMHSYCDTAVRDEENNLNSVWKDVLAHENPKEFAFPSYSAWLEDYRRRVRVPSVKFYDDWVMNTPTIAAGIKHTGFFNAEQDSDGTIRGKSLLARTGNLYFPTLALKAFLVAHGYNASPRLEYNPVSQEKEIVELDITSNETGESQMKIPVDVRGGMMINYAGKQQMFPYLSFADLMSDSDEIEVLQRMRDPKTGAWEPQTRRVKRKEFMKDKIFIVGATAVGIYDLRVTPFEENYPGPEIHLNVIDNMIQRNFFRTLPDEKVKMILVLTFLGLTLSVGLSYLGAAMGFLMALSLLIAVYLIDRYLIFANGVIVTVVWPLLLIGVLYVFLTSYRYLTEERGKKELRQTFQKYVSPAIVEEILAHPQNVELGGRKSHLTVFFSDVRGFTTISEKLDPRALSDLLNMYLTPMTDLVFKNRGTLDKYMGDAIMAFFGAPIAYPDHAKYACRCALQSLNKLFELQKEFERKGLPTIDIGIGLNSGEVSVGNMGSQTVRSYTVMGDAVNLASRLEGINKEYGTRIILSEMTYNEVKNNFVCREVDWVRVKGKILPVKIYELIAEEIVPNQSIAETLKWFKEGYENYHLKAWQKGLDAFAKALDINPTDEVSKLYIQRCQNYIVTPPPESWDGVFVMKTK
jgi:adenylate cyclase